MTGYFIKKSNLRNTKTMPMEKSAGAIVFYQNPDNKIEYLLLQHNKNYWNFPKGLIEKNESEIETVKREIQEETEVGEIEIIPGFKVVDKYFYRVPKDHPVTEKRGKAVFKIVVFYLVKVETKEVKISWEHSGYEWLDFEGAVERLKKYKGSQRILEEANNYIIEHEA